MSKPFSPLNFLGALGAGGIAVAPFAFMQYLFPHGKGLVTRAQMHGGEFPLAGWQSALVGPFEAIMVAFGILHVVLLAWMLPRLFASARRGDYRDLASNPLTGAAMLTPHLAIAMTFNVFIGVARYFLPVLQSNFQALMLPALAAWMILLYYTLKSIYGQLHNAFSRSFDLNQARFGWMMLPFSLGMVSVVGSGIAALAKAPAVAHMAAFLTLVGATGSVFLLVSKLLTLLHVHYQQPGLPDRHSLPSILAVVPILTVLAIVGFRLSHYAHVQLGFHMEWVGPAIVAVVFAFQTFYLGLGLVLMREYFRVDLRRAEYHPSQWGLVCPFVAWTVLGAFVGGSIASGPILVGALLLAFAAAIGLYLTVLVRMASCTGIPLPAALRVQPCA